MKAVAPYLDETEVRAMAGENKKSEYRNDWIAKTYDRINLTLPKGKKDEIKAHAESKGESVNAFINRAIDNQMERDKDEG